MAGTVLTIEPTSEHTHTVILLHGRGSNAVECRDEVFESVTSDGQTLLECFPQIRWVLPSAHERVSTVFQESMTEWFDIYSLTDPEARQDLQYEGIQESATWLCQIIQEEIKLVSPSRIFIGGISQGCAVSVLVFLFGGIQLAGFIGIAGWLPFRSQIRQLQASSVLIADKKALHLLSGLSIQKVAPTANNTSILPLPPRQMPPCLLCHGKDDPVVDVELGRSMRDTLSQLSQSVTWAEHDDCGHWIKESEGVDEIARFILSHVEVDFRDTQVDLYAQPPITGSS